MYYLSLATSRLESVQILFSDHETLMAASRVAFAVIRWSSVSAAFANFRPPNCDCWKYRRWQILSGQCSPRLWPQCRRWVRQLWSLASHGLVHQGNFLSGWSMAWAGLRCYSKMFSLHFLQFKMVKKSIARIAIKYFKNARWLILLGLEIRTLKRRHWSKEWWTSSPTRSTWCQQFGL